MTYEKLRDPYTVLTEDEIEQLRKLCYEYGNSWFPIDAFFNDIKLGDNIKKDSNFAYKDLWIMLMTFINIYKENEEKEKVLSIIRKYACKHRGWEGQGMPADEIIVRITNSDFGQGCPDYEVLSKWMEEKK